ncbi:hypothetical protein NX059_010942 [Plenodomus lindquistii]|nr:hypothetical protein NX059_010942 [Plenodomus lindquistii]
MELRYNHLRKNKSFATDIYTSIDSIVQDRATTYLQHSQHAANQPISTRPRLPQSISFLHTIIHFDNGGEKSIGCFTVEPEVRDYGYDGFAIKTTKRNAVVERVDELKKNGSALSRGDVCLDEDTERMN